MNTQIRRKHHKLNRELEVILAEMKKAQKDNLFK